MLYDINKDRKRRSTVFSIHIMHLGSDVNHEWMNSQAQAVN